MATGDESSEARLDTDSKEKTGGCLNLGWGCMSVFIGGMVLLPIGLWL